METATVALAVFLPVIVALVKQTGWSDTTNRLVAIGVYFLWSLLATIFGWIPGTELTLLSFLGTFATTFTVGTATYQLILKTFGLDDAITEATSIVKPPVEDVVIEEGLV